MLLLKICSIIGLCVCHLLLLSFLSLISTMMFYLIIIDNTRGQAEKEFKVEVEAIGRVRHKNLVRLLGYCAEGAHRYSYFLL